MRILFLNGHPVWTYGLPWGLRQLGHEVKIVSAIEENYLRKCMDVFQPDLLITVGWIHEYTTDKLNIIKKVAQSYGCTHAYWATEDYNHLEKWSLKMVKTVQPDIVFTINADCVRYYQDLGIPAYHLEFGYNPEFMSDYLALPNPEYNHDIALVANSYNIWEQPSSFRFKSIEILLKPLIDLGYDLVICGEGWERSPWLTSQKDSKVRCLGPVSFEETFNIYKYPKIIINLQNQNIFDTQVTSRTFEIMGSGGFQLTAETPAIKKLFSNCHHLVMSSSPKETVEMVDYYLRNEKERLQISEYGKNEVLTKHTYDKRAAFMMSCLDLIPNRTHTYFSPYPPIQEYPKLDFKKIHGPAASVTIQNTNPQHSTNTKLTVGRKKSNSFKWTTYRSFILFDLTDIPINARLDTALLYIELKNTGPKLKNLNCYPVLESWAVDTINWLNQPAFEKKAVSSIQAEGYQSKKWLSFNITPLVQKWLTKTINNHGLCLCSRDEIIKKTTIQTFAKPYLSILYFTDRE